MAVVVDTDVVSYLFKSDTRASLYRPHLDGQLPIISFMSLAELERWTLARGWGARRAGKPILTADAWVAATALAYDMCRSSQIIRRTSPEVAGLTIISEK